jgi:hypothetical protein
MIKRATLLWTVVVIFLVASCGTATTPQSTYASKMQPTIKLLTKWQDDFSSLETLLNETLDPASGITRLQLIELYNIAMEYPITRDDYSKLGLMPLDALVAPAVKVSKDGQTILDTVSAITPVEETQADHQIILDCLKSRIAFAQELSTSIKELNAIDMTKAGDLIACEPFDASLQKLSTFVNQNK